MASWRELYPLEKTKPLKKSIGSLFVLAVVLIVIYFFVKGLASSGSDSGAPQFFKLLSPVLLIIIFIVVAVSVYVYQVFYMKYYFYDLNGKTLVIAKGVFSKNEISLPVNRLQDVYINQDILDRIFGLYDVHVSSATSISGFLSHIDGVNKQNSEALKELLLGVIHN